MTVPSWGLPSSSRLSLSPGRAPLCPSSILNAEKMGRNNGSRSQRGSHQVHGAPIVPLGNVSFNLKDSDTGWAGGRRQRGLALRKLGRFASLLSPASAAPLSSPAADPAWAPEPPAPGGLPVASAPSVLSSKPAAGTASASAGGAQSLGPHTWAGHSRKCSVSLGSLGVPIQLLEQGRLSLCWPLSLHIHQSFLVWNATPTSPSYPGCRFCPHISSHPILPQREPPTPVGVVQLWEAGMRSKGSQRRGNKEAGPPKMAAPCNMPWNSPTSRGKPDLGEARIINRCRIRRLVSRPIRSCSADTMATIFALVWPCRMAGASWNWLTDRMSASSLISTALWDKKISS